jgi:hypothetical protein
MIWRHLAIQLLHLGLAYCHCHQGFSISLDFKDTRSRSRLRDIQYLSCRVLQHYRVVTVTILSGRDNQDLDIGRAQGEFSRVIGLLVAFAIIACSAFPSDAF